MASYYSANLWPNPWLSHTTDYTTTIWPYWAEQTTSNLTTGAWFIWSSTGTQFHNNEIYQTPIDQPILRSPQDIAEMQARQAELDRAYAQQYAIQAERDRVAEKARRAVMHRAEELLVSHLNPAQLAEYKKDKRFMVHGRSGARYLIECDRYAGNIIQINKPLIGSEVRRRLCCHARSDIPLGDQILTQKLLLEHHEDEFVRTANITAMPRAA